MFADYLPSLTKIDGTILDNRFDCPAENLFL